MGQKNIEKISNYQGAVQQTVIDSVALRQRITSNKTKKHIEVNRCLLLRQNTSFYKWVRTRIFDRSKHRISCEAPIWHRLTFFSLEHEAVGACFGVISIEKEEIHSKTVSNGWKSIKYRLAQQWIEEGYPDSDSSETTIC